MQNSISFEYFSFQQNSNPLGEQLQTSQSLIKVCHTLLEANSFETISVGQKVQHKQLCLQLIIFLFWTSFWLAKLQHTHRPITFARHNCIVLVRLHFYCCCCSALSIFVLFFPVLFAIAIVFINISQTMKWAFCYWN